MLETYSSKHVCDCLSHEVGINCEPFCFVPRIILAVFGMQLEWSLLSWLSLRGAEECNRSSQFTSAFSKSYNHIVL